MRVIVGVNRFQDAEPGPVADPPLAGSDSSTAPSRGNAPRLLTVDPALREQQAARLAELRRRRDAGRTQAALDHLRACAAGTENVLPALVECARAQATLGEMAGTLRTVFGEHQP
jgi:(2R)-ethylmalonyl-CoA mutase